jgi:hypothetical protein
MLLEPNAFNASDSVIERRNIHQAMCKKYFIFAVEVLLGLSPQDMGMLPRCMVHSKKALKNSSLLHGASKFPKSTSLLLQVMRYLSMQNSLVRLLISCKKKYIPKSWWSADIVSMLLALHLQFISVAAGEQSLEWLNGKSVAARTKFEKMKTIIK